MDMRIHGGSDSATRLISRRGALVRLGAGGLGVALAARGVAAVAQEATPPADLPEALQAWVTGWEMLDADMIASAFAEDAIVDDVPTGIITEGRDAIQAYLTDFFAAFSDASTQTTNLFTTGDQAAAEWVFSGTYTGQVPGFPPGEGQQIMMRGVSILELAEGQIARETSYFDVYGLLVQMGVVPPPDGPAPDATPPDA